MLSTKSPSGARTATNIASINNSPMLFQVSLCKLMIHIEINVASDPPIKPSTVLFGLIQARNGVLPADDPTNNAPTSLAITPTATMNKVSVPTLARPGTLETPAKRAANEPIIPIHNIPSEVMAILGIGLD